MLDAVDRTRPIMQYVHDLESKVRAYRQAERMFNLRCFFLGFGWGAGAVAIAWGMVAMLHA